MGYLRQEQPMNDANQPDAWLDVETVDDARVVSFHGEHDISTVDLVRERLRDAALGDGVIIIDLADATFIDSSVAGALLEAYRRDTTPRMRFVLAAGTPPRELFTVLGFDGAVPIYEHREDALTERR
jgi:anti-sigma B factor antagonist